MDNSRRSVATNEDSISMYLSFDTDDTMSSISKWQSVASHIEVQSTELDFKLDKTLEENQGKRKILQQKNSIDNETDHVSPLRPFDKSLLNKHNALSSTPSKIIVVPEINLDLTQTDADQISNKENAHPNEESGSGNAGDNSTLSSSVDITATTVKANTLMIDGTIDEPSTSVNQYNKTSGNNVYPLSADVILENITEVSHEEEPSVSLAEVDKKAIQVDEVVNEVSHLIERVLKISEGPVKSQLSKQVPKAVKSRLSSIPMPRPRRSMLPTSGAETRGFTVKQRMSVVVKTTLNSPARRLSTMALNRRSCLPTASKGRISINPTAKAVKPAPLTTEPQNKPAPQAITSRLKNDNAAKPLKRLNIGSGSQSTGIKHRCKYCDKNFALERALHIHLMQNCDKIPPSEKRKLQFTELNHVRKAELPKLGAATQQAARPNIKTPTVPVGKASSSSGSHQMAPPSAKKVPKNVAHAGVCRTPTKSVLCHTCKQSFRSVLDYTNHCLTKHSKSNTKDSAEAARA
ncbi:sal-like protein 1 isoform X2 [Drosophila willistoni]|uniref:sal-like protein 1 isoform X2 n=1 Tax=Drosophila willistoni TaxID=7260 RepID=UPI00017D89C1|nr:sal-like protein 1 isoform X2 [Drosophila willistoni]